MAINYLIIGELNTLRLEVTAREFYKCKEWANDRIKACEARGSRSHFQHKELWDKLAGNIGELKWDLITRLNDVPGEWQFKNEGETDDGVDWISELGVTVDVKTAKRGEWVIKDDEDLIIIKESLEKAPEIYVFTEWDVKHKCLTIIGGIPSKLFKERARFVPHKDPYSHEGRMIKNKHRNGSYIIKVSDVLWDVPKLFKILREQKGGVL